MSNPDNIQDIRERVLQMARQIETLSRSQEPPDTFFPEFLKLLVGALGAQAGVVWLRDASNRLSLSYEINLADTGFRDNPQANALNQPLLGNVISTGEAASYSPLDDSETELPTNNLHVLAAVQVDNEGVGVVQIFQRSDSPPDARPGFLQFVEQMCGYASRYFELQQNNATSQAPVDFWKQFERLILQLQRSLDVDEVAATTANDVRLLLGCDRLSVAVQRGKKVSIKAISGQDSVNPRANLVCAMAHLATKAMAMRDLVLYSGHVEHLAPQIEVPLADFVQESGSRMVMVVPLFQSDPLVASDDEEQNQKEKIEPRNVIGCLIIEQISKSEPQAGLMERIDLVADHVAAALYNAQSYQQIFLLRFWKLLGRSLEWFHGRKLAKTAAVFAVLSAIGCAMVFIPWEYRVEGKGQLMPVVQRAAFAKVDGEVEEIYVKDGEHVKAGQKLLLLRNVELTMELNESEGQLNVEEEQIRKLAFNIDEADTADKLDEATRMRGEKQQTEIRIRGLKERILKLKERDDTMLVRAPIDGVVATFRLEQLLKNRPVSRGETLVEVMDDSGDWRIELEVAEKRMGHILRAQEKLESPDLVVNYVPATSYERTYEGRLQEIATRSETSEEGAVVELLISTDASVLPDLRIGADVSAKINCGQRSLGYVLFGDVVEAAQRYFFVWF